MIGAVHLRHHYAFMALKGTLTSPACEEFLDLPKEICDYSDGE
jgi:hypothetical protein